MEQVIIRERQGGHPTDCPSLINPAAALVVGEMRQKLANYPTERDSKSEEEVGLLAKRMRFPPRDKQRSGGSEGVWGREEKRGHKEERRVTRSCVDQESKGTDATSELDSIDPVHSAQF